MKELLKNIKSADGLCKYHNDYCTYSFYFKDDEFNLYIPKKISNVPVVQDEIFINTINFMVRINYIEKKYQLEEFRRIIALSEKEAEFSASNNSATAHSAIVQIVGESDSLRQAVCEKYMVEQLMFAEEKISTFLTLLHQANSNSPAKQIDVSKGAILTFISHLPTPEIVKILHYMYKKYINQYDAKFKAPEESSNESKAAFNIEMTIKMLIRLGVGINYNDKDQYCYCERMNIINHSMLGSALYHGYTELAQPLLNCGANIDCKLGSTNSTLEMIFAQHNFCKPLGFASRTLRGSKLRCNDIHNAYVNRT